jgi:hypothetical protein
VGRGRRPPVVFCFCFTISRRKITGIDLVTDPERIGLLVAPPSIQRGEVAERPKAAYAHMVSSW